MARTLFREWFANFRFPGHEQVKMIDSDSELGLIPKEWEPVKLGDIAQDIQRSINPEQIDPETPYFGLEQNTYPENQSRFQNGEQPARCKVQN